MWSAECAHGMCSACRYEDCDCRCHLIDREPGFYPDEPYDEEDDER